MSTTLGKLIERPLVTFAVATFNQKDLVEESVRSALWQTYSPLEILISDDCSTDNTYEIIQKIVASYNGPHDVVLNRNRENIGIGRHWDQIGRMAKGRLIIHAAGDDISLPNRADVLVEHWGKKIGEQPVLISSDGMKMTFEGKLRELFLGTRFPEPIFQDSVRGCNLDNREIPICGFSLATDKRIYDTFSPLTERFWHEVDILPRRALLLGRIMYVPDVLVYYRDNGLSKGTQKNQQAYMNLHLAQGRDRLATIKQSMTDLDKLMRRGTGGYHCVLDRQLRSAVRRLRLIERGWLSSFLALCLQLFTKKDYGIARVDYLKIFVVRYFPVVFFCARELSEKVGQLRRRV